MQTKHCKECGETKPISEFTRAKATSNYKESTQEYHTYCKSCNAVRAREWRKNRPAYRGSGKVNKFPKEDRLLLSAIRQRISDAKRRSIKYSELPVTVTDEDLYQLYLKQDRKCALTLQPLHVERRHPLCLSLDKIDPHKGYSLDNVQWVAWCVNRAKGDLHLDDFFGLCKAVLDTKEQRLSKA